MYPILANMAAILSRQRGKGGGAGDYESTAGWDWGWRVHPVTGEKQKWHNGVDLAHGSYARTGTPIYAPWSGEVTKLWHLDRVNGNALRVEFYDSPSEIKGASFVHLDSIAPLADAVGAQFNAGDVIGYLGNTGRSTGAHLHLTFWGYSGVPIAGATRRDLDPLPYLDQMASAEGAEKKILGAGISGGMLVSAFIIFMILRRLR